MKKLKIINQEFEKLENSRKNEATQPKRSKKSSSEISTPISPNREGFSSFDPTKKVVLSDTRSNPNHSYYQYIHPCRVSETPFLYRYHIIRNGENVESKPFDCIKKCHEELKQILEGEINYD